jgi:catechol 2,3-dioxygenase-like lactoylglutathione lyase family enzyme
MVAVKGLTHHNLLVADVHRSKAFYESVFGFQLMFWAGPTLAFVKLDGTNDVLALQQSPDAARGAGNIDHFGFRLADDGQREQAIEEVIAAGGALVERGEHGPGNPYAYVKDPDGHVIEL